MVIYLMCFERISEITATKISYLTKRNIHIRLSILTDIAPGAPWSCIHYFKIKYIIQLFLITLPLLITEFTVLVKKKTVFFDIYPYFY